MHEAGPPLSPTSSHSLPLCGQRLLLAVVLSSWFSGLDGNLDVLLRMGISVLCGAAVGFHRSHLGAGHRHRLRVHVLVGLSSCLLVLAAGEAADSRSRAIQGVATGIGFLGAGEILQEPRSRKRGEPAHVRGLTSAASIWFTAALGVTVATSRPAIAASALVLALVVLTFADHSSGPKPRERTAKGDPPL